jgi:hypothetical protein
MNEQLDRIEIKLIELEGKIEATRASSEKVRKYILWTGIITAACIIIPLFILPFVIPSFLTAEGVGGSGDTSLQGL